MNSETAKYQVRDAVAERDSMEMPSGGSMGRLKSFTPSSHHISTQNFAWEV